MKTPLSVLLTSLLILTILTPAALPGAANAGHPSASLRPSRAWATPPPDLTPQLEEIRAQEPLLSEDFNRDRGDWRTDPDDGVERFFEKRTYHMRLTSDDAPGISTAGIQVTDSLLEADVALLTDEADAQAGLLFRYVDPENYSAVVIAGNGDIQLLEQVDGEELGPAEPIGRLTVGPTQTPECRLSILVQGSTITVLCDDSLEAVVEQEAVGVAGDVGLYVRAAEASFNDLELWELTPQTTTAPVGADVDETLLEEIRAKEPVLSTSFLRPDDQFPTTNTDGIDRFFARRAYHMAAPEADMAGWSVVDIPAADFLLEVTAEPIEGLLEDNYGVIFRYVDDDNFYRFLIDGAGAYSLAKRAAGEWETLIDWTESDALQPLETGVDDLANRLSVLARGSEIVLLANDQVLGGVRDESYPSGAIGLAIAAKSEDGMEVAFDDLEMWALQAGNGEPPVPTETPAPPTAEPAPAAAVAELLRTVRAQEPLFVDQFEKSLDLWSTGERDFSATFIDDGALYVQLDGGNVGDASFTGLPVGDFLLEVDARHSAGAPEFAVNLLFRVVDQESFYVFQVRSDGSYSVSKIVQGQPEQLVEPTPSTAIQTGEAATNRLGVLAQGATLTFLANDTVLHTIADDSIAEGAIGLGASIAGGDATEIAFDDLRVWEVKAKGPVPTATPVEPEPAPTPGEETTAIPEPPAPQEPTPSPEPTTPPEPTAPPKPTASATPIPTPTARRDPTPEDLNIDWSALQQDFNITNIRIADRRSPTTGTTSKALVFDVEALTNIGYFAYLATYLDEEGNWLTGSTVNFILDPAAFDKMDAMGGWGAGAFGEAYFEVPANISRLESTVLERQF